MIDAQRRLGATGIATSTLVLGCARLGSALTPLGRRECIALIDEAFALGVRHFDTASAYGQGDSERYLGQALADRRAQVWLSSKAGQRLTAAQRAMALFKAPVRWLAARRGTVRQRVAGQRGRGVPRCFEPGYIERSLRASLRRLRTDHLDIFYLHSPEPGVLDDAVLIARIETLRGEGLFRAFGVSCDAAALAWKAAAHPAVQVVQFAFDAGAEGAALLNEIERHGKLAVLRGFVRPDAAAPGDALRESLAHALRLPALGGLIVGTTNAQHLRDNVAAFGRALAMEPAR